MLTGMIVIWMRRMLLLLLLLLRRIIGVRLAIVAMATMFLRISRLGILVMIWVGLVLLKLILRIVLPSRTMGMAVIIRVGMMRMRMLGTVRARACACAGGGGGAWLAQVVRLSSMVAVVNRGMMMVGMMMVLLLGLCGGTLGRMGHGSSRGGWG